MKRVIHLTVVGLFTFMLMACELEKPNCFSSWAAYEGFMGRYLRPDGQLVDPSAIPPHTTSEGQSYALFFALVMNDRERFDRILKWTEEHLSQGSLELHLPAWEWRLEQVGPGQIFDSNSASDADLWLSYTLVEAGRLWKDAKLGRLGQKLAEQIVQLETDVLPGLGQTILPGARGFHPTVSTWRLNPSYLPPFILTRMSLAMPEGPWPTLRQSAIHVISASTHGFAGDWLIYDRTSGFSADTKSAGLGSYDAIRVYLWLGMTSPLDQFWSSLPERLSGMDDWLKQNRLPPEHVDIRTGEGSGQAPPGFSAALIPYLLRLGYPNQYPAFHHLMEETQKLDDTFGYYNESLRLFGEGFHQSRFGFDAQGGLTVPWGQGCKL